MLGYTALKLLTGKQRQTWSGLGRGSGKEKIKGDVRNWKCRGRWERPAGVKSFSCSAAVMFFYMRGMVVLFFRVFLLMGK